MKKKRMRKRIYKTCECSLITRALKGQLIIKFEPRGVCILFGYVEKFKSQYCPKGTPNYYTLLKPARHSFQVTDDDQWADAKHPANVLEHRVS